MTDTSSLFLGIISGQRRRDHATVADRADRIAGGLRRLGVRQGDSVGILMRNDIAFIEAAYAAMRLGAYAGPINWHFKPEEINYVLKDSGTSVLIGHADMLHQRATPFPLASPFSARRRRRKFSRTTRSIPIISLRPISRPILNPGSSNNALTTARRCRSRRT
jgi:acyl-coenzyme A synthetase/AMP-(fatty) acid ligase